MLTRITKREKCAREIEKELLQFLKVNHGFGNGYETFVQGEVERNSTLAMDWCTPAKKELTGKEASNRGYDLNKRLHKIMTKYGFSLIRIIVEHIAEGCFDTIIEIPFLKTVDRDVLYKK